MAKIPIKGLHEEHRLGILRRHLLDRLRIQQSKPNEIKRILRVIPQQLIDRSKFAYIRETSNRPVFIANNDSMPVCRFCVSRRR
jgi:hypothetical protein